MSDETTAQALASIGYTYRVATMEDRKAPGMRWAMGCTIIDPSGANIGIMDYDKAWELVRKVRSEASAQLSLL